MQFSFRVEEETQNVVVDVHACAICQRRHVVPLLKLEEPIRIQTDHHTYAHRIRCPKTGSHILIEYPLPDPMPDDYKLSVWLVRDTPTELVPHQEKRSACGCGQCVEEMTAGNDGDGMHSDGVATGPEA